MDFNWMENWIKLTKRIYAHFNEIENIYQKKIQLIAWSRPVFQVYNSNLNRLWCIHSKFSFVAFFESNKENKRRNYEKKSFFGCVSSIFFHSWTDMFDICQLTWMYKSPFWRSNKSLEFNESQRQRSLIQQ